MKKLARIITLCFLMVFVLLNVGRVYSADSLTNIRYVDHSVMISGSGSSLQEAFKTIQEAIEAASDGDTVLVAKGLYQEGIDFKGKAIVVKSEAGPKETIIDVSGLELKGKKGVVTFQARETKEAVLEGFSLKGHPSYGIYCVDSSPVITNNNIVENLKAGIYCSGSSSVTIANNKIAKNGTPEGATGEDGAVGIISESGSSPRIVNNIISQNYGSGIYCHDASPKISNNTIADNTIKGFKGAGIIADSILSYATIINNIITGHHLGISIGGKQASPISISYNNVWRNITNYQYPLDFSIEEEGNISKNPLFINSNDPDFENRDYHLRVNSPCIDSGTNEAAQLLVELGLNLEKDFEGAGRILDRDGDGQAVIDIGADEFSDIIWYVDQAIYVTGDGKSWGSAKKSIAEAIGEAKDKEIVLVREGLYTENIDFNGKAIILKSLAGPKHTIIDGSSNPDPSSYVISFHSEEGQGATIDGFTIRHGRQGSILCTHASPSIVNNIIEAGRDYDSVTISYRDHSSALVANNLILGEDNAIGIACSGESSVSIINNTLIGSAEYGISFSDDCAPTIANNIIAYVKGYGLAGNDRRGVSHNNFWKNKVNYLGQEDGFLGPGDISLDPLFVNSNAINPEERNYHLRWNSPCIDAGIDKAVRPTALDFDNQSRIIDGRLMGEAIVDIGLDEYNGPVFKPRNIEGKSYPLNQAMFTLKIGRPEDGKVEAVVADFPEVPCYAKKEISGNGTREVQLKFSQDELGCSKRFRVIGRQEITVIATDTETEAKATFLVESAELAFTYPTLESLKKGHK